MRHLNVMIVCSASLAGGWQPAMTEAEFRANILAWLGRSATWPDRPGLDPQRPFIIGVLGAHPFEDQLDRHVQGLRIRNRAVTVQYMRRLDPQRLLGCDILYLAETEEERLNAILKVVKGSPILVVGGTPGFAQRGVMLNLPIRNGTFLPEVNLKALREARLEIHPAFLVKAKAQVVE